MSVKDDVITIARAAKEASIGLAKLDTAVKNLALQKMPNGLMVGKMRIPIGVIGIIYESRPNVTADAAGLCLKSGNAVILRGGSEAFHSNQAIVHFLQKALVKIGVPQAAVQIFSRTEREAVQEM